MKKGSPIFSLTHVLSSVLMLALLTWLTVCLPIVNQSNKIAKAQTEKLVGDTETETEDGSNPLTNTNEEKTGSGTSLLSEYLHNVTVIEHHFTELKSSFKGHPSDLYIAYHPDLVIPPPEV